MSRDWIIDWADARLDRLVAILTPAGKAFDRFMERAMYRIAGEVNRIINAIIWVYCAIHAYVAGSWWIRHDYFDDTSHATTKRVNTCRVYGRADDAWIQFTAETRRKIWPSGRVGRDYYVATWYHFAGRAWWVPRGL